MSEFFEIEMNKRYGNQAATYYERSKSDRFNRHDVRDQQKALMLFKETIGASVNLALNDKSVCSDDSFLKRFLYAKKFCCDDALELLINYFTYKKNNRYLLKNINIFDEKIILALRDGQPGILRQRDRRGRKVLTFAASNWDVSKYNLEDIYRALLLTLDKLLENVENQALGFVIVVDWTNFTFKQSTHLSPKTLKLMIDGLQNCFPARFKGIHFISQPWYVELAMAIIKPFLEGKIKDRFFIHGSNLSTLHGIISKDILPPDLGGEGPSLNNLDWYHYLLESSQNMGSSKNYRLITHTIYTKTPMEISHESFPTRQTISSTVATNRTVS